MTKTVLESKFVELKGLDRISSMVHEMKCLWREINKSDFGIDGEIELLTPHPDGKGYQVTGGILKVQAKSGQSYITQNSDSTFSARSSKDDFELWYKGSFHVLFIIYHAEDDKLYWKEMKSYLESTPDVWRPPYKITFVKSTDVFDSTCIDKLRAIVKASPPRVSYEERERIFSNLLRIRRSPTWIWSAPCSFSRREQLWQQVPGYTPPFTIASKRLYTFDDLQHRNCVFRPYCDTESVLKEPAEAFWDNDDGLRQYVYLINQLLGKHLKNQGISYNSEFRRNYFPREDDQSKEFKKAWYNVRTQRKVKPRVVCKYYEYGVDQFWRHLAASMKFQKFGNTWFLQIIPMYFFTQDGLIPYDSKSVGPYTTRKKAQETNYHVLNHVLFWANALAGLGKESSTIKIWLNSQRSSRTQPIMTLDAIPTFGIADFAIPYDPATYQEEEEQSAIQGSLFSFLNQQYVINDLDDEAEEGEFVEENE